MAETQHVAVRCLGSAKERRGARRSLGVVGLQLRKEDLMCGRQSRPSGAEAGFSHGS